MSADAPSLGYGQQDPGSATDEFNMIAFAIRQALAQISTMIPVKVMAVTAGAGAPYGAAGTVDVLPLVTQLDGGGNATTHGTVFGLPWFRIGGSVGAVICDPKVDDVGMVVAAQRDISAVKSTRAQANPGSLRKFSLSDGIYLGQILAEEPAQYVAFTDDGMKLSDKNGNSIVMSSTGIEFTGAVKFDGAATFQQTVDVKGDATLEGNAKLDGNLEVDGTSLQKGAVTMNATVDVKGAATMEAGATVTGAIAATGAGGVITSSGNVTAMFGNVAFVDLLNHVHRYALPTSSTTTANTTVPNPGS